MKRKLLKKILDLSAIETEKNKKNMINVLKNLSSTKKLNIDIFQVFEATRTEQNKKKLL